MHILELFNKIIDKKSNAKRMGNRNGDKRCNFYHIIFKIKRKLYIAAEYNKAGVEIGRCAAVRSSAVRRAILATAERGPSSASVQQLMSSVLRRVLLSTTEQGPSSVVVQQLMSSALRRVEVSSAERWSSSVFMQL